MVLSKALATASLTCLTASPAVADNFLIHIHTGPENPTMAALGFLVALTAVNEGHDVNLFLAGDGAALIADDALSSVDGIGTGSLQATARNGLAGAKAK